MVGAACFEPAVHSASLPSHACLCCRRTAWWAPPSLSPRCATEPPKSSTFSSSTSHVRVGFEGFSVGWNRGLFTFESWTFSSSTSHVLVFFLSCLNPNVAKGLGSGCGLGGAPSLPRSAALARVHAVHIGALHVGTALASQGCCSLFAQRLRSASGCG